MRTYKSSSGLTFAQYGEEPYIRRDSAKINLWLWSAPCKHPGCADIVTVKTPVGADPSKCKAFGKVHCAIHKLSKEEATRRWVDACRAGQSRKAAESARKVIEMYTQGLGVPEILLLAPIGRAMAYRIIANYKKQNV